MAALVADAVGPPILDALVAQITAAPITLLHLVCHGSITDAGETVDVSGPRPVPEPGGCGAHFPVDRASAPHPGGGRAAPLRLPLHLRSAPPESEHTLGGLGQSLVRDLGMPAVVAMTQIVSVATADALSVAFYPRLASTASPIWPWSKRAQPSAERHDITVPALYRTTWAGCPCLATHWTEN